MRQFTPDGEKQVLNELIAKHGDNFQAMARDKKNKWQHTAKQLEKKVAQLNLTGSGTYSGYLK